MGVQLTQKVKDTVTCPICQSISKGYQLFVSEHCVSLDLQCHNCLQIQETIFQGPLTICKLTTGESITLSNVGHQALFRAVQGTTDPAEYEEFRRPTMPVDYQPIDCKPYEDITAIDV